MGAAFRLGKTPGYPRAFRFGCCPLARAIRGRGRHRLNALRPGDQVSQSLVKCDARLPIQNLLRLRDIADVVLLIALAPVRKAVLRLLAGQLADPVDDLEQVSLILRSASDVV